MVYIVDDVLRKFGLLVALTRGIAPPLRSSDRRCTRWEQIRGVIRRHEEGEVERLSAGRRSVEAEPRNELALRLDDHLDQQRRVWRKGRG